jgi:hypothetical protein
VICTTRREASTRFWRTLRVGSTRSWLLVGAPFVFLAAASAGALGLPPLRPARRPLSLGFRRAKRSSL